ncbi:hypothetical protein [Methanosphaerula palustris]|uniref:Transglutaminase-like domain-containing protein n=1 Tax=Methanosphaerula palustris (strain ATCC BAA-1556 / DSM 19958 / E1-9c) TaxID=521011 RepID=B8GJQ1_METPE|nr:hypothetical protein [Methanosphaerula palustris]ACL15705.1 conserved hypothetical protein [Methanosphaerula palustris E1-9c]
MTPRHLAGFLLLITLCLIAAGCIGGVLTPAGGVVYPHIVPDPGATTPQPPEYTFKFQETTFSSSIQVDGPAYAGAVHANKTVLLYKEMPDQEWIGGSYLAEINDPAQTTFYQQLLAGFRDAKERHHLDSDAYLELITAFVQQIPYKSVDGAGAKFPIQTYQDQAGDCDDKSLLLAALLSAENYNVSLLVFPAEEHMAIGVNCSGEGYQKSGYAFIEATNLSYVGVPPETLEGGVVLRSAPLIVRVGNGTEGFTQIDKTSAIASARDSADQQAQALAPTLNDQKIALASAGQILNQQYAAIATMTAGKARQDLADQYNQDLVRYQQQEADYNASVDRYNHYGSVHNYIITHQYDREGTYRWLQNNAPTLLPV